MGGQPRVLVEEKGVSDVSRGWVYEVGGPAHWVLSGTRDGGHWVQPGQGSESRRGNCQGENLVFAAFTCHLGGVGDAPCRKRSFRAQ